MYPDDSSHRQSIDVQKAVKIDLDPFAEEYDMNHKRRGVALILNHVHFESMSTRKGSVKDSLDLKLSLSKLGFDVRIYTDPTVKVIAATLQSSKYHTTLPDNPVCAVITVLLRYVRSVSDDRSNDGCVWIECYYNICMSNWNNEMQIASANIYKKKKDRNKETEISLFPSICNIADRNATVLLALCTPLFLIFPRWAHSFISPLIE